MAACKPSKAASGEANPAGTLIADCQPPEWRENKFLLDHLVCGTLLGSPSQRIRQSFANSYLIFQWLACTHLLLFSVACRSSHLLSTMANCFPRLQIKLHIRCQTNIQGAQKSGHLPGQRPSKSFLLNEDQLLSPAVNDDPYWPFQLHLARESLWIKPLIWTNFTLTNHRAWFSFWILFCSIHSALVFKPELN